MLEYRQYESLLDLSTIKKDIPHFLDIWANKTFVAQEKIWGVNYAFYFDGEQHKQASRNNFVEDNFFNCGVVFKYRPNIESIYTWLCNADILEKGDTLIVYGELFGGGYKGAKEPNAKTIQKGVQYHPDNEFMAFDIRITKQEGESFYLPFMETESLCRAFNLPLAPVMDYGTLDELLELNNEFNSYVPEDLGLERLGNNICEGVVIRPYAEDLYLGDVRVIIKSKNEKFSEKTKTPKNQKSKSQVAEMPEEMKKLFDDLCLYLTNNRLQALQSKIGEPQWNQVKMVGGLLVKDAIEDYEKDQEIVSLKDETGDDWKQFNKQLMTGALDLVREYYKKEI